MFLIGYMGSGKSTLGRRLAEMLEMQFFDLDRVVEKMEDQTIADIIRSAGEDDFRKREQAVLHRLLDVLPCVVAAGGGTPCFFDNMEKMKDRGTVVYLRLSPALLAGRLRDEMAARPLLDGVDSDGLQAFISKHLAEREHFYNQAHIIWDAQKGNADELKLLIARQSR